MDKIEQHLKDNHEKAINRLIQFLKIPSVSTDPAYVSNMVAGAKYVVDLLKETGLEAKTVPTGKQKEGHPVIFATTKDDQVTNPNAPRVLFYGHYDVQPPDPQDKWISPPFEPQVRKGAIYARGACDDKGQVACFLEALLAYKAVGEKFPCHITILIEGEEECGSANLPLFIEQHKEDLQADIALISDTTMWVDKNGEAIPAICYALRGLLYFDIKLYGPTRDLHSGVYGGTLANPATILPKILGKLTDENNRITIPGFYDNVIDVCEDEKKQWGRLDFDETNFLKDAGGVKPFGEAGYSSLERRWARPACDINGLYGGYQGKGAKTVIPTYAGAKVSFRLVANQDPSKISAAFHKWINAQNCYGLRLEIEEHGQAYPVAVSTTSPWIDAASKAIKHTSGKLPALVREGATIPIVGDLKNKLGLDSLLIGFGLDSDAIHSPNEHFALDRFALGCRTHAALLKELAKVKL